MRKVRFSVLVCLAAMLGCTLAFGDSREPDVKKTDKRVDISFDNLQNNYRIIGRLGKPVGEYAGIRGIWKSSTYSPKTMFFHITHVNGHPLKKKIVYPAMHFYHGGPLPFRPPLSKPADSEIWELRVFERMCHYGTPDKFYAESGLPTGVGVFPFEFPSGASIIPFELTSQISYHRRPRIVKKSNFTKKPKHRNYNRAAW